jgi:hypothetical protein
MSALSYHYVPEERNRHQRKEELVMARCWLKLVGRLAAAARLDEKTKDREAQSSI